MCGGTASQTRRQLCICPRLAEHVADRQHVDAMIFKERCELAEERWLLEDQTLDGVTRHQTGGPDTRRGARLQT